MTLMKFLAAIPCDTIFPQQQSDEKCTGEWIVQMVRLL